MPEAASRLTLSAQVSCREARRSRRQHVRAAAAVRGEQVRIVADVLNVSFHGVRIRTADPPAVGSHVRLKLPMFEDLEARVVWACESEAGCEFVEPLSPDLYELIVESGT